MTGLETALRQICAALTETRSSFALVGGLAVSARTEPRFTRDVGGIDDVTRPQDVSDLRALLGVASADDVTQAQAALALIAKRGYHRGRELQAELEKLARTFRQRR